MMTHYFKRTAFLVLTVSFTLLLSAFASRAAANRNAPTDDFVITVKTDNPGTSSDTQFTIPTFDSGYNYNVDCDDDGTDDFTAANGDVTCAYAQAGTYTVRIKDGTRSGSGFPRIYFDDRGDKDKLLTIEQWGTGKWTSMTRAFYGCSNLTGQATDAPDLSNVTDMSFMFASAHTFNQDIGNWDTANVTNMRGIFWGAKAFNQGIRNWNVSNVTDMSSMFRDAEAFNQYIGNWDTAHVTSMNAMFYNASSFNQGIRNWNTANVTSMNHMFYNAKAFNKEIGSWDTANVINTTGMFEAASAFNQGIGN